MFNVRGAQRRYHGRREAYFRIRAGRRRLDFPRAPPTIAVTVTVEATPESSRPPITAIRRNAAGQIVVEVEGREEPCVDARVARCFPRSFPRGYISIRDKDGKEIALFKDEGDMDDATRVVVEDELRDKVFSPEIQRITSHKEEFGVVSITAETDHGQVTFQLRSRDDVRVLPNGNILFRDADGNTYQARNVEGIDATTRKYLRYYE